MKKILRKYVAGLLLLGTSGVFAADIPECVNANPNSVDDVQRCISRIPGFSQGYSQMVFNCQALKAGIDGAQRDQPANARRIPSCRVLGDALMRQNGSYPAWYACTGYDGSQAQLNQCTKAVIQLSSKDRQIIRAECQQVRMSLVTLIQGNNDAGYKLSSNQPSCESIAGALQANGVQMTAVECQGYRANDPRHIQQCMQPTLNSVRDRIVKMPTCDESRQIYLQLMVVGNGKTPDGYAAPACSMIEPVVSNILGSPAVASTPAPTGNNPVANLPAAAAIPSAAGNTAQYPAAQYPATQNPTTQYPAAQQYPDYSASATSSKEQQRAQRRQERAADIQSGANAASQILGTLGIGSGAAPAPGNNSTVNTGTSGQATPVYNGTETENQRKIREQQQKVNDAQQTMQSVKGVLDMFGGSK